MNRYDHTYRMLPSSVRRDATQKVNEARGAIFRHRSNGYGPEDDAAIVQQFDLTGLDEFWEVELSEMVACSDFIDSLALHWFVIETRASMSDAEQKQCGPQALKQLEGIKAGLRKAMRAAFIAGENWISHSPARSGDRHDKSTWLGFVPSDTIIDADLPSDGIDLQFLTVLPRQASEWLLSKPKRRHLVPTSLAKHLQPITAPPSEEMAEPIDGKPLKTGAPGRPTSSDLVRQELERRAAEGVILSTLAGECRELSAWLKANHRNYPQMTSGTVENAVRKRFNELKSR